MSTVGGCGYCDVQRLTQFGTVIGLSDPYCVATVGGNKHKSRIIKADLNPRWEETFDIPVGGSHSVLRVSVNTAISKTIAETRMQVEVYDKDTFGSDDSLGTAEIALSDLVQGIEKPMWVCCHFNLSSVRKVALSQKASTAKLVVA